MNCQAEIEKNAIDKLKAAEILASQNQWLNAYYLGGYYLELTLKSKVCEHLGVPDIFDFENKGNRKHMEGIKEGLLKTHSPNQLFFLTGGFMKFLDAINNDLQFNTH